MSLSNLGSPQNLGGIMTAQNAGGGATVVNAAYLGTAPGGNMSAAQAAAVVANLSQKSNIVLTVHTAAGANAGAAYVSAVVPGTSFSVIGGAADTSVYNFLILNVRP